MQRHQSVPQRKALKQSFTDPLTTVRRGLYQQARSDIQPRYQTSRLGVLLVLLALWLTISHFTSFRTHMSAWIVTGVFPAAEWHSIAFYVVSFLFSFFAFVWINGWIDRRQENEIDARYLKLKAAYSEEHHVNLEDR